MAMRNIKHRALALGMLVAAVVLAVSACGNAAEKPQPTAVPPAAPTASGLTAEGRLEPLRYAELSLAAGGSISELPSREGDAVTAGQVIARVQSEGALTLEQAQAQASKQLSVGYQDVRTAQNKLDAFDIPSRYAGMHAAEAARVSLEELNAARAAFEPYKDFSIKNVKHTKFWRNPIAPKVVVDTGIYTGDAYELKKRYDSAWADYRKVVQWLDLESARQSAQVQLAQAQKDYASLQDTSLAEETAGARAALADAELRSPFAGTITNLDLKLGQFAASGQPVVTVADLSGWVIKTTDLTEKDVVSVKEGQPVTATLDAIPGVTLKGTVLSVAQNYGEKQGDTVYEVTILLTDTQPAMRWGMTAQVHFGD
jgi:multidrug efflux pump subunit AcrA (membrane-fusion protein)